MVGIKTKSNMYYKTQYFKDGEWRDSNSTCDSLVDATNELPVHVSNQLRSRVVEIREKVIIEYDEKGKPAWDNVV